MEAHKDGVYTDPSGRRLEDYPHPSLAVDTALLTVEPDSDCLSVLLVRRPEESDQRAGAGWSLPGTFMRIDELFTEAVQRSLREKAGIEGTSPVHLGLFDALKRDSRYRVVSVAYLGVVAADRLANRNPDETKLVRVRAPGDAPDAGELIQAQFSDLPFEHCEIIAKAVTRVRTEYAAAPDPYRLLPEPFTILQLRQLHEAVAGGALQRDTFRRTMVPLLAELDDDKTVGARGRPAARFRHR